MVSTSLISKYLLSIHHALSQTQGPCLREQKTNNNQVHRVASFSETERVGLGWRTVRQPGSEARQRPSGRLGGGHSGREGPPVRFAELQQTGGTVEHRRGRQISSHKGPSLRAGNLLVVSFYNFILWKLSSRYKRGQYNKPPCNLSQQWSFC